MSPDTRRLALTTHVTVSVGWLGAIAAFLVLAITGLTTPRAELVRGSYIAMQVITWSILIPLSAASLASGLVMSLGTTWGLFRHYWVIVKLLLTSVATGLLLLHTSPIDMAAGVAAQRSFGRGELHQLRVQLVFDASAAIVVLLAVTALSIYKPKGVTPYGWRRQLEERAC